MEPALGTDMEAEERRSRSVEKASSESAAAGQREPSHEAEVDAEAQVAQTPTAPEWKIGRQELYIILSLTVINMVVALDSSIIITALKTMTVALGADTTQGFWIGTSFLLASTVIMPPVASLSEIFGRPICLMFSLAMFTLGSILCCAAHGVRLLLAGRAVQGVGAGGIWMVSLLLLTDLVPLRHRPKWWAVISLGWAAGLIIGPLVGGAIVQRTTWRWLFYLNFPFCAFGLVVTPWLLTIRPRAESMRVKLARIDWVGGALFTASLTLTLFALSSAGIQFAWSSAEIIATLAIGFVGLIATGVWEGLFAKEPMLKHSLFYNWSSNIAYFGGFVQGLVMYGENYYVPFFFQSVKATTPLRAGINLLPALLFVIPSGAVTGALVSRYNNYRYAIWLGWFFVTLSCGLEILWDADVSTGVWVVSLIVMGIGHGIVLNAQTFACQAMAQPGDIAAAAAMYGFVRQLGSAVGVCVGSTTWQNVAALKLGWEGLPVEIAYHAEAYLDEFHKTSIIPDGGDGDDPTRRQAVTSAFVFGFVGVWQVFLGISAVVFCLGFFVRHFDMDKAIESEHRLENSGGGGSGSGNSRRRVSRVLLRSKPRAE
ncbi:Efflux pump FUS6 [Apiospora rasikravindrae]|uniref:Efflux pump FUS6 n=1 Tax=Apiospora rasikravindrae TaxID=990691 RepID=A0ABR1SZF9_9PEZI